MTQSFLDQVEKVIDAVAQSVPVEVFVVIGSFLEDIIAPIPSPLILSTAGSLLRVQEATVFQIVLVIFLATAAKTFTAYLFYRLGDFAEDVIVPRFGKYIGLSHKQIESMGKMFNGGHRDEFVLFALRALPVTPTSLISIIGGIIKLPIQMFLRATFLGYFIRNAFFILVGYYGTGTIERILPFFSSVESLLKGAIAGVVLLFIIYAAYKKYQDPIQTWIEDRLQKK